MMYIKDFYCVYTIENLTMSNLKIRILYMTKFLFPNDHCTFPVFFFYSIPHLSVRKLIFIGLQAGWKNKKKKTLKFQLQSFLLLLLLFSFLFIWWSRSPLCASWRHKNFLHSRTPEMPKQYTLRNKTQKTENMIRKKEPKIKSEYNRYKDM